MAEDFPSYPYSGDYITLTDAVDFICGVVYPDYGQDDNDRVNAPKRVRRRICQAGENELLRILEKKRGRAILATELFDWAVECKGWDRLLRVHGLPRTIRASGQLRVPRFAVEAFAVAIPADQSELERPFIDVSIQLLKSEGENERLRLENAKLCAEVESSNAKKAQISKTRAESAKKPRPK